MRVFAVIERGEHTNLSSPKNTICLWFDKDARDGARFSAATLPDGGVTAIHTAAGVSSSPWRRWS